MKKVKRTIELLLSLIRRKNKVIVCNTPIHENLGDHAIAIAELNYLRKHFPDFSIVEVEEDLCTPKIINVFSKLISKNDIIAFQGGGFMGDLWPRHELCMHNIIKKCPDSTKIIFPQTCYLSDKSDKAFNEYKDSYKDAKNLYVIVREKKSFEFVKNRIFLENNLYLFPDIVLSLNYYDKVKRDGVLICLREDKESILSIEQKDRILKNITSLNKKIYHTSTLFNRKIESAERESITQEKLNEFSKVEVVITDRLHGMIFAAITGTPCLVLDNVSGKVAGVYNWIKELDYIKVVKSDEINTSLINEMISQQITNTPDVILEKQFKDMENAIRNIYSNRR